MTPKAIAVTGSTGFVGSSLVPALSQAGYPVARIASREPIEIFPDARCLIHLAAIAHRPDTDKDDSAYFRVNRDLALNVARKAAESGIPHMIHFSTSKVSGGSYEDDPMTAQDAYSRSKAEAEAGLQAIAAETGMHITCLRPPVIYGPGVKGNIRRLFEKIAGGRPLPSGALLAQRSVLGIDNLTSAVQHLMERPHGFQVFHVADTEPVTTGQLVDIAAHAMGVKARVVPVPRIAIKTVGRLLGRGRDVERLTTDSVLDTSRIQATEWTPPFLTREGFAAAARAFVGGR